MQRHATSQASHLFIMKALAEYIESEGLKPWLCVHNPESITGIPAHITSEYATTDEHGGRMIIFNLTSTALDGMGLYIQDDHLCFSARFRGVSELIQLSGREALDSVMYAKEFPHFSSPFRWGENEAPHLREAYDGVRGAMNVAKEEIPKPKRRKGNHLKAVK